MTKVRTSGGGGGGASGDGDIIWTEVEHLTDKQTDTLVLPDRLVTSDKQKDTLVLPDTLYMRDQRIVPAITAAYPEVLHLPETLVGRTGSISSTRTGTTDNNAYVDGWVDGIPLNNGVNHGNESPLTVGSDNIIATQADAFTYWDLSRFASLSNTAAGTLVMEFWIDTATLSILDTVVFDISKKTARPFTESTLTWNNKPAVGTNLVTRTIAALLRLSPTVPQYQLYTITLTAAEYSAFLGFWMMVRVHSSVLIGTPFLVASREHAVSGERPTISFDFKR